MSHPRTTTVRWNSVKAVRPPASPVLVAGRCEGLGNCDTGVGIRSACGWVILVGELKPAEITHWARLPNPPRELTEETTKGS